MRVVLTHALSGAPVAPPQVAWQLVVIQAADSTRVIDPVLALARDNVVHFYQVIKLISLIKTTSTKFAKFNYVITFSGLHRRKFAGSSLAIATRYDVLHRKQS